MRRRCRLFLTLALVAAAVTYLQLTSEIRESLLDGFASDEVISVKVLQLKRTSIQWQVQGNGKLQTLKELNVVSPVAGHVSDIRFKTGDWVAEGQVLGKIHSRDLSQRLQKIDAALQIASADLRQQEKRLAVAESALERARQLHSQDLIAGRDVREAEEATAKARAEKELVQTQVAQQQAVLEQTRYLLRLSTLVAPISGVIVGNLAESGAYLERSKPVLTIASVDPLMVVIEVSEQEAGLLREGMTAQVRVEALAGRVFEGQVTAVGAKSGGTRATVAEIRLPNRNRLLNPGMSADVTLIESGEGLLLPQQAIFENQGNLYVAIVVNEKVEWRMVTTGRRQSGLIEIRSGVGEGDWIVVGGQTRVMPNSKIRSMVADNYF